MGDNGDPLAIQWQQYIHQWLNGVIITIGSLKEHLCQQQITNITNAGIGAIDAITSPIDRERHYC
jgi:hypothetical protein